MKITAFWKDALERIIWSFVAAAASSIIAIGVFDLDSAKAAGIAGLTAVMTVIKVIAARQIGDPESAAIG